LYLCQNYIARLWKFKGLRNTDPEHAQFGVIYHALLVIAAINFELPVFTLSKDQMVAQNLKNGSRDTNHALLGYSSRVG